jgi:hypothetical protein
VIKRAIAQIKEDATKKADALRAELDDMKDD